jgi:hypothetical protein
MMNTFAHTLMAAHYLFLSSTSSANTKIVTLIAETIVINYIWSELHTEDGNWCFNSSTTEQVNAWFGGYQAIMQEMSVDWYNFFLNEMIKWRNRLTVKELKQKMKAPYWIP